MNNITIIDQSNQFTFQEVGSLAGFEYPDVISAIGDISGRGGAVYLASKFGRRRLSWQGLLKEDVLEQRRALEYACKPGRLKTIQFETCDGVAVETQVEIERITMPYKHGRTKYLIEATAPDWRFISQEPHTLVVNETLISGGVDIPAEIPMSFESTELTPHIINNLGTENSEPTFTITGPGRKFIVRNQTTGEQFTITQSLGEGDYIVVRTDNPSVMLNGSTPIYDSLSGTFWTAQPGQNEVTFVAIGKGSNKTVTIEYFDAYIGI